METQWNDDQPTDPVAALRGTQDAQRRMASRLRSAWWFHALRGLATALMVFGLAGRPAGAVWLLALGLIGVIVLSRWRARAIGVTGANPERWRFVVLGAPWTVVLLVVVLAAVAFVVFDHGAAVWQLASAGLVAGVVTAALGPVADASARGRMARPIARTAR